MGGWLFSLVGVYVARPENWNMPRPEHHDFMW